MSKRSGYEVIVHVQHSVHVYRANIQCKCTIVTRFRLNNKDLGITLLGNGCQSRSAVQPHCTVREG